jgi:hypothetical protein
MLFKHPNSPVLIKSILILTLVLIAGNLLRLQPWVYLYLLFLFPFAGRANKTYDQTALMRWIIPYIYIYSALHKFQLGFLLDLSTSWLEQLGIHASLGNSILFGLFMLLGEGIAGTLLFSRWKKQAAIALIAMHGALLFMLIFVLHGTNSVVWPWNITMAALLYQLYITKQSPKSSIKDTPFYIQVLGYIVAIIPAIHLFVYIHPYLSFALYSGNIPRYELVDTSQKNNNHQSLISYCYKHLNVPCPDNAYTLRQIQTTLPEHYVISRVDRHALDGEPVFIRLSETIRFLFLK